MIGKNDVERPRGRFDLRERLLTVSGGGNAATGAAQDKGQKLRHGGFVFHRKNSHVVLHLALFAISKTQADEPGSTTHSTLFVTSVRSD
jgi:hypothetical protein